MRFLRGFGPFDPLQKLLLCLLGRDLLVEYCMKGIAELIGLSEPRAGKQRLAEGLLLCFGELIGAFEKQPLELFKPLLFGMILTQALADAVENLVQGFDHMEAVNGDAGSGKALPGHIDVRSPHVAGHIGNLSTKFRSKLLKVSDEGGLFPIFEDIELGSSLQVSQYAAKVAFAFTMRQFVDPQLAHLRVAAR